MGGREVLLMCPSHKWGVAVDASGTYRVRCTGKFCRREGFIVRHSFDLKSGVMRTHHEHYRNPRELLGTQKE